jgi:hypothetical protein
VAEREKSGQFEKELITDDILWEIHGVELYTNRPLTVHHEWIEIRGVPEDHGWVEIRGVGLTLTTFSKKKCGQFENEWITDDILWEIHGVLLYTNRRLHCP